MDNTASPEGLDLAAPAIRPSLLDPRLLGDPWMARCPNPDFLVLYHHSQPVAVQPGTALDQSSFNSWIFRFRSRYPRRRLPQPK